MTVLTKKKIHEFVLWLVLPAAVALFAGGCAFAPSDDSGGTGSEIVGKAEYPDSGATKKMAVLPKLVAANGLPVVGGRVFAYRNDFIPDTAWAAGGASPKAYTDTAGQFHVLDVPRGLVVVEANDGSGKGVVTAVNVDKDSAIFDAGILTLQKSGAVNILAHTSLPGLVRFYVSVKGTRCVVRGSLADVTVSLDNIPTGMPFTVNVRVYEPVKLEKNFNNIIIPAGGTADLGSFTIQ